MSSSSTTTTTTPSAAPAPAPTTSETYTGSCHCSRFKYSVTQSPPLTDPSCEVVECNCSICARNGYLLIYVKDSDVVFEAGSEDEFKKYTFAPKHAIAHYFCPTCGTSCFAKSTDPGFYGDVKAVNVRTLAGFDLKAVRVKAVDGRSV
ncbi:hypothetical protein K491DRAFT_639522 [Lophiostoma macrostomum CBS 122681]|uniref:CENP-V/GFA domain-containing protein n=1 Tax=Lophiostoma macrostomum CBS 122681 TaxID=1314788 RepID=A0A6A6SR68_9PLEO|nr:hypothetical protein K491DRAFT_639522 [Lophiostoma macrostomum CBS 122681]